MSILNPILAPSGGDGSWSELTGRGSGNGETISFNVGEKPKDWLLVAITGMDARSAGTSVCFVARDLDGVYRSWVIQNTGKLLKADVTVTHDSDTGVLTITPLEGKFYINSKSYVLIYI